MLRFEGVSFSYTTNEPTLEDISFSCADGSTVAVVGPSGSGKTTLVNLAAGLLKAQKGVVEIDGETPMRASQARRIGIFPQRPTLFPWLSAEANVALPLRLNGGGSDDGIAKAVLAALERARIAPAAKKYPAELSGGMQTRVALARALVQEPRLLLLDEPFSALDEVVRDEIYEELQAMLAAGGQACLLVTHNLIEAALLSDEIIVLGLGGPGKGASIQQKISNPLAKPRTADMIGQPEFGAIYDAVRRAVRGKVLA